MGGNGRFFEKQVLVACGRQPGGFQMSRGYLKLIENE